QWKYHILTLMLTCIFFTVMSATIKVKQEHRTAFFGEDVNIQVPSLTSTEILFNPRVDPVAEVVLLRGGNVTSRNKLRAKLNAHGSHLVLEDVDEEHEGTYVIKNTAVPSDIRHIVLIVRDCAHELTVKYGETYHIPLHDITGPIILEFRHSIAHSNQTTEAPPVVLLNQTSIAVEEYKGRLSISDKRLTLHKVTGMDEGKNVKMLLCLFYGGTLKINLFLSYTKVNLAYTPDSDHKERMIVAQGELVVPMDPSLDGRLSVDRSMCYLKRVHMSDRGLFSVTDLLGFHISDVYLEVEAYKMPPLYVAILSLLGLLAFLLLVCLLSCLIKVHRRAEKAKRISLIAQQAGKGDGEAFRQVVHEAYTRFAEDSTTQSQWDNDTDNNKVEIKGLEVSKAGRYHTLSSDKNLLEMSDSGVEFNSSMLPLDSDTEVPHTYTSQKLLLDSVHSDGFVTAQPTIAEGDQSNSHTPDSILSASPATLPKADGVTDSDLMGATTPETVAGATDLDMGPIPTPIAGLIPEASKDAVPVEESVLSDSGLENSTT
uniref:Uncharacterized protein n=1 Tax=Denticeps clupeoides TaxID=299321 RepID=A0AAY4CSL8_9TELE